MGKSRQSANLVSDNNIFVNITNDRVGIGSVTPKVKLDVIGDVNISGVITASSFSGSASNATYATNAGVATYATTSGVSTYATTAGVSTYSTTAGIATYATTAGISTVSQGLTGIPNITIGNITGSAATFTNLTVNGTQTVINTNVLDIADINIGIASTATKLTNSQLDGAGITIYGSQGDKTLTWNNANSRMAFSTDLYSPRYYGDGSNLSGVGGQLDITSSLFA